MCSLVRCVQSIQLSNITLYCETGRCFSMAGIWNFKTVQNFGRFHRSRQSLTARNVLRPDSVQRDLLFLKYCTRFNEPEILHKLLWVICIRRRYAQPLWLLHRALRIYFLSNYQLGLYPLSGPINISFWRHLWHCEFNQSERY